MQMCDFWILPNEQKAGKHRLECFVITHNWALTGADPGFLRVGANLGIVSVK